MSERSQAPLPRRPGGDRPPERRLRRPPPPPDMRTGNTKKAETTGVTGNTECNTESSYRKGGRVKHTGKAKLHKDEVVLPTSLVKKLKKLMT